MSQLPIPQTQIVYEDPNFEHTILWVSRHLPLEGQIRKLKEKLGAIRIVQLSGIVPNAEHVVNVAKQFNANIIVPVLPLSFIARLAELARKENFIVLLAKMDAIAQVSDMEAAKKLVAEKWGFRTATTYADGTIKIHEFKGFEKVKAVKIETEQW